MDFRCTFISGIQFCLRLTLLIAVIGASAKCSAQNPADFLEFTLITDGDNSTNERGFADNSINMIAYVTYNLYTVGDQQFAAYYGQSPNNNDPSHERIIIARRTLGETTWETLQTTFEANNINDDHDNVNFAIDGDGFMHLSWGMHSDTFHYAVSPAPVTGSNPLSMGPDLGTITGRENTVTYPQFYHLPNGDVLYSFREGSSGNGDNYLNRFDNATRTWSNVHVNSTGTNHLAYMQGTGFSPTWNSYLNRMVIDGNGRLHITWMNRFGTNDSPAGQAGYQTNRNIFYAYSDDFGATMNRMDGTPYGFPIVDPEVAGLVSPNLVGDIAVAIPEGSSLINQTDMAVDHNNNPMYVTWYAPNAASGDHRRQYMLGFWDGDSWEIRQISFRTNDSPNIQQNESRVRELGRPFVVVDDEGRVLVVYRDNEGSNGITIAHSKPFAEDPERLEWSHVNLTSANMGTYEPNFDPVIWENENKLHLLYQEHSGFGNNMDNSDVFVMEWDAAAYFEVLGSGPVEQLVDDFSGDLSNYTNTVILDVNGGLTNSSTWTIVDEQLTLVTDSYDDIEQHAFINNGLTLEVGEELQLNATVPAVGNRNIGLYVGGTAPVTGVRQDYITVYTNVAPSTQVFTRGFDGTTEYNNLFGSAQGADRIFIARIDVNVFEVGFYLGGAREVIATREPAFANTANFVGIYADVRATGTLGVVDNLTLLQPVSFAMPETFNVFRGVLLGGSVDDVHESDDLGIAMNPGFVLNADEAPVWLEFQGVINTGVDYDLIVESQAVTPGLTYTVEMRNANTGQYEELGSVAESFNTDTVETFSIDIGQHVGSGGEVEARIGWRQTGFVLLFPWSVELDVLGWQPQ